MTAPLILKRGGAGKGDGVKKGPIVWTAARKSRCDPFELDEQQQQRLLVQELA